MSYKVELSSLAFLHIEKHEKAGNKKLISKIDHLILELAEHPRTGTGKPEQLKYFSEETWSRRIDAKHRLIYEIVEDELIVIAISAYGHYDNK